MWTDKFSVRRSVLALSVLVTLVCGLLATTAHAQPTEPTWRWSERHPPPPTTATFDRAVGSGLDSTNVYAVYERELDSTIDPNTRFQIVKYDLQGAEVASTHWPTNATGVFSPRAMKVVEDGFTTRIYVAGDGPELAGERRVLHVIAFDDQLNLLWHHWTSDWPWPRDERAVALDANNSYVAVVAYNLDEDYPEDHYWATVVLTTGGTLAFPIEYHWHVDPFGLGGHPDDVPVAIALEDIPGTPSVDVAVLGEYRWQEYPDPPVTYALVMFYRFGDPTAPQPEFLSAGINGNSWVPYHESYPADLRLLGGYLYVTGRGRQTYPAVEPEFSYYFAVVDAYDHDRASYSHVVSGEVDAAGLSVDAVSVGPWSAGTGGDPCYEPGATIGYAWATGYTTDSQGNPLALTIQYRNDGTRWDTCQGKAIILMVREWRSEWQGPFGSERPHIGMFVRARETFASHGDVGRQIYVAGATEHPATGVIETFLIKFNNHGTGAERDPYWFEIRPSDAGGDDIPASLQEREIGTKRHITIGSTSWHPSTADDMLTMYWDYEID